MSAIRIPVTAAGVLRWGVLGLGQRELFHLQRLSLRPDCRVVAVCDASLEPANVVRTSVERRYTELAEFLADPEIEVVLLATPASARAELVCAALAHGKHVVLEEPLAETIAEADRILHAALESGRMLGVWHAQRHDGEFRTALAVHRAGHLGEIRAANQVVRSYVPAAASTSPPPAPASALLEFGPRYIQQALELIGNQPARVCARQSASSPSGRPDEFWLRIEFSGGQSAQIEFSQGSFAPQHAGWILHGTRGGYQKHKRYRATDEGEIIDVPVEPLPTDLDAGYAELVDHLRRGTPLPTTLDQARRVVRVLAAAGESALSGQWIDL